MTIQSSLADITPKIPNDALKHLRARMDSYHVITEGCWQKFQSLLSYHEYARGDLIYSVGEHPDSFSFIHKGLARVFHLDENGQEYNKRFFSEGEFPACMTSLLTAAPSALSVECLENSAVLKIDFRGYRQLLEQSPDLMRYHILYLEKNWLLEKDERDNAFGQTTAGQRYQTFVEQLPHLVSRVPQYHIASHLGITPVQLSRLRKQLQNPK